MTATPDIRRPLDRNGPDPLFLQVRAHFLDLISQGACGPGHYLPSERDLARTLAVSRLTLRRALTALADEGVVRASVGRGWFIAQTVSEPPDALMSFTRMVKASGTTPYNRLVSAVTRNATVAEAQALERLLPFDLVDLVRVRLIDDEPVAVHHTRLEVDSADAFLETDWSGSSHYELLEQRGVVPTTAEYTITARVADERLAGLLHVRAGVQLLVLIQTTRDGNGRPFELDEAVYRVDRYRFRGSLRRGGAAPFGAAQNAVPELLPPSERKPR